MINNDKMSKQNFILALCFKTLLPLKLIQKLIFIFSHFYPSLTFKVKVQSVSAFTVESVYLNMKFCHHFIVATSKDGAYKKVSMSIRLVYEQKKSGSVLRVKEKRKRESAFYSVILVTVVKSFIVHALDQRVLFHISIKH